MWNLQNHVTDRNKRYSLMLFVVGILFFIFNRGLTLHEENSITDRVRFHAIPVALSVLYHHHPHDYTGLHAIAIPFQGSGDINHLINAAKLQQLDQDKEIYYWVADDRGFADYVIAAFYVFGAQLNSLYYMWFLILSVSCVLFLISFSKELWALSFLCLVLIGIHLSISTLPLSAFHREGMHYMGGAGLHEPRFLDVLAMVAVMHMMLLAFSSRPLQWLRDKLPLIGQVFIFIMLYHARTSLGWEIVAILFLCLSLAIIQLYKHKKYKAEIGATIFVGLLLLGSLLGLNIYKHITYHPKYFSEMGVRTFWHNALMGLQEEPVLTKKYNLTIDDAEIARAVIKFSQETHQCTSDIEQLDFQTILNTLGGHGVINWIHYERCAKKFFISIVSDNKIRTAVLYGIRKPLASLDMFAQTINHYGVPLVDNMRTKLGIGWYPLSVMNLSLFAIILLLSFKELIRARKKLFIVLTILLVFSLIPSVAFYPAILTLGGFLVTSSILFYLILTVVMQYILGGFKKSAQIPPSFSYPMSSKKLTIVIPAFNEEKRILVTMQEVHHIARKILDDFEMIVIDDGSTDATHTIAMIAANHLGPEVKVVSQKINQGVGAAFHLGLTQAKFPQLCLIPGDNAFNISGIELLFSHCGSTPLVISYRQNMKARTPLRHLLSRLATLALRMITGFKVRDAHSLYLFPVEVTRSLNIQSAGYGYHIEILSRLLNRLQLFSEVPVILNPKPDASSGVMKPRTLFILGVTLSKLFGLRLIGKL